MVRQGRGALVIGACLVLASQAVLHQRAPQRVEQVVEVRWCPEPEGGFRLERVRGYRVDGVPAGQEQVESLLIWREMRPDRPALQ